ncbi:glycerate 2-kinase [Citrobacter rodentium]|uniref:Glycerate kinase 2 n=2 Tax=Citrobacter rodentium TaxID=67825 RepID=D2TQ94_CITRI|nr:glycerate 2-kinase [Citrobacter rodentium]KIQ51764.1 glycerate kinase [Citrobacter rodentium]QBY31000.1 glycerate 2-kinase [Citrobacter rodentium]UHO31632.1 glycerate 2-kinase [Citrobacter rodentium NBRC 105723 = DSM 16636]CBG91448.1 glycerate kinase 2 [Citrobacter rodentium ICC168]HAT8014904.1 glycerate 2-kinase [Citrobacter rodentium NBRC 105723 = DSM 16636]
MKIVIAPDSYKESLSASEVAQAIEKGFREIFPDAHYVSVPVADGGEGMVEAMIAATQGTEHVARVTGPLGEKVNASWGMSGDGKTAFIEMAAASGLALVPPEKRNPLITTSRGTGELILQALESGARNIIIGIGGSATNDGGAGMMQALGAKLCDASGTEIGYGGGSLMSLNSIDITGLDPRLKNCTLRVACDVTNPLVGEKGASRVFGPQKGANEALIVELDSNLTHYADVIKKSLRVDVKDAPGAGAAGGMGAALMAFLGAELKSGIEIVTQALNLEEHIHDCTLVITGEGRIDSQSIQGKVPVGVANVAKKYHKPVIGIAGSLTRDVGVVHQYGIDAVFSVLTRIGTLEEAFRDAFDNIYRASRNIAATLAAGMRNAG